MADTSAIVEPEMPEKKYSASTTDMPSPPRTQPTRPRARFTSAYDIPQRSMRAPAKTNAGTARSTQLCEPATSADGSFCSEKLPSARPITPESPSAKTIGVDSATISTNAMTTEATISLRRTTRELTPVSAAGHHVRERDQAVDDHQGASGHRREIEPAQVEHERRRERLAVELGHLPAVDRDQLAERDDQDAVPGKDRAA